MVTKTFLLAAGLAVLAFLPPPSQAALDRSTAVGGRVAGKVFKADGTFASHVTVDLRSTTTRALRERTSTDTEGMFVSGILPADKYVMTFSRSGIILGMTTVVIEAGKTANVTIELAGR